MTRRIGVDLGARKVSWSTFVDNELLEVRDFIAPHTNRATELHACVAEISPSFQAADLVVLEEALVGRGVRASLQIAHTLGAMLYELGRLHIPTLLVPVSSWKKATVGKGNAKKEEVAAWLQQEHPDWAGLCDSQDGVDATCIGIYAGLLDERAAELRLGSTP